MIQALYITFAVLPHRIKRGKLRVIWILDGNIIGVVIVVKAARPLSVCFGVCLNLSAVIRKGKLMCRYVYFYARCSLLL